MEKAKTKELVLTEDEKNFIKQYRKLNDCGQWQVYEYMTTLFNKPRYDKDVINFAFAASKYGR